MLLLFVLSNAQIDGRYEESFPNKRLRHPCNRLPGEQDYYSREGAGCTRGGKLQPVYYQKYKI